MASRIVWVLRYDEMSNSILVFASRCLCGVGRTPMTVEQLASQRRICVCAGKPSMSHTASRMVATLITIVCVAGTAHANLVLNGSFELGIDPGVFINLPGGSTAIDNWIVTGDGIDYVGSGWQSSDGNRSLDLDGSVGSPSPNGGVSQTFATTSGTRYVVQFDMAGNPGSGPTIKPMRVSAAGQQSDFFFDITGQTSTDMGWETNQWEFMASDSSTTLEFRSLTTPPDTGWGPALDNVLVQAVPEPSTALSLLVTILFFGGMASRARR